jgi:hypothetical protein
LIGLTSLWTNGRPTVSSELDPRRARFVLGRIDEILAWEKTKEKNETCDLWSLASICVR